MSAQLTVNQAAIELGVTPGRVRTLIASGRLKAEKVGPIYLIKPRDLAAVRERKPGRPKRKG